MKRLIRIWMPALAATTLMLAGCGGPQQYGDAMTTAETTAISDILSAPDSFAEKTVKIEGKIVRECPTGCWFDLGEGAATVFVDIKPNGLAIPQKVGRKAVVEGTVHVEGPKVKIVGKGVSIK